MLEKTLESPLNCKEIKPVNPKGNQPWIFTGRNEAECCWSWSSNTLATWYKELTNWKRSWCWERLRAGEEEDDRGWDYWMASPTRWTWVWANSGRWWRTGKPGVLQFIELQRVRHNLATEQQQKQQELPISILYSEKYVFKSFILKIFIYLAVWDLSCGMCCFFFLIVVVAHRIFLVVTFGIFICSMWTRSCSMWDLLPWSGTEPRPPTLGVWSLSHWAIWEVCFMH